MIPRTWFIVCILIGFSLLALHFVINGEFTGFFLLLGTICLTLFRRRIKGFWFTTAFDGILCLYLMPIALPLVIFMGMYHGFYAIIIFIAVIYADFTLVAVSFTAALAGMFLRLWENEIQKSFNNLHLATGRYYDLESLQNELIDATIKIEQMTALSERARISREIHDNAGHEIVAAFIALQSIRGMFPENEETTDVLEFYDAALERLDNGMDKIREAVHNLNPLKTIGVETLHDICANSASNPKIEIYGDTELVPVHIWSVLEACLNESLTNVLRHANPTFVNVCVDVTPNLVRLNVENDGAENKKVCSANFSQPVVNTETKGFGRKMRSSFLAHKKPSGNGLRNIRYRVSAVGGTFSVNSSDIFNLVCVIPIKKIPTQKES